MYRTTTPHLLSQHFAVALPDLPGHGTSSALGPFSFDKASTLLISAIRALPSTTQVVLVGVSLGGQVVLDILQRAPELAAAAVVSGAPIHPPDEKAGWEMPHMPSEQEWVDVMMEDVAVMGMENAKGVQEASFAFRFEPRVGVDLPPVLVMVGEGDVPMAKRDFEEVAEVVTRGTARSERLVLKGAWHNHPIDVPEQFAAIVGKWVRKVLAK